MREGTRKINNRTDFEIINQAVQINNKLASLQRLRVENTQKHRFYLKEAKSNSQGITKILNELTKITKIVEKMQ